MKKTCYSTTLAAFMMLVMISHFLSSCTKNDMNRETEVLKESLKETELLVSTLDFEGMETSLKKINEDLFEILSKRSESKSPEANEIFRYELQKWFSKFPIEDVCVLDSIFLESYFRTIKGRSPVEVLSISDLYISIIHSDKVPISDQERLYQNISLYRDMTIYFRIGNTIGTKELDGRRDREYWLSRCSSGYKNTWSDCWDCCMSEMWEDLGIIDYLAMAASGFVPWMGWQMASCGEDCARTGEVEAK